MQKLHARLVLLLFVFFSCQFAAVFGQSKSKPITKVLIDCSFCTGQKIAANVTDLFSNGFSKLVETEADAAGQATLNVPATDPLLAYITVGPGVLGQDSVYRLYLEPNQVLKLTIEQDKIHYSGKLSAVNEYLLESEKITNKVWDEANAIAGQFRKFSKEEQEKVLISFNKRYSSLHQTITNDSRLSAQQKDIIIANNQLLILWKIKGLEGANIKKLKEESSHEVTSFLNGLPVKASYLKANMDTYRRVIDLEIRNHLFGSIYYALEQDGKEKNEDTLLLLKDKAIRSNTRLAPIKEFLLAKNISWDLNDYGLKPQVIQNFTKFREEYPTSPYISSLESKLDEHYDLAEGKEARDFAATDINGKEVRLSDLKGKVVYVDSWATWCGPCIAEFPHSKKMMEHYKGNDNVVFLFVSVDEDTKKWKSYLQSGKAPSGIHVNHKTTDPELDIYTIYRMSGIPHYILIDKAGKIKVNKAPRPSEKESYALIDELLK
ncbi:TlpA disulfide reductase family protein [Telluribacter sp.]|jgi:thiol-disulfide isomerase/thioredoxin|uniref:TlpA family protein disulfide reductase n=1 Tax=Telluribacter sp. TaxID=1978767 RepID=UPI002E14E546|nr:TlpA disulfide reductase family protein [Telluribacter sp.]